MVSITYSKLHILYEKHRNLALLYHLLAGKLYKPSHLTVLASDLINKRGKVLDNSVHCEAAIDWLFNAQDATGVGGVAADYSFSWGWRWLYPETSGYIIPTLFDYAYHFPDSPAASQCRNRALHIADWLVNIQLPNGAYVSGLYPAGHASIANKASTPEKPSAFETSQVLMGLTRACKETGEKRYLDVAVKTGDWLVNNQLSDGSWALSLRGIPHSYDSFIAWSLAKLWELSGDSAYQKAARKNLDWCLSQQMDNGFYNQCFHTQGESPWTHAIGYAMQGLIETGAILKEDKYLYSAVKAAQALLRIYSTKGFKSLYVQQKGILPARFNSAWKSDDKFSCLTGNAQVSLVWSKLYMTTKDIRYLNGALKINEDLKMLQNLDSGNKGIRGGIKGSHPIYGLYGTFRYPNWATKFFIDTLIAEEMAMDVIRTSQPKRLGDTKSKNTTIVTDNEISNVNIVIFGSKLHPTTIKIITEFRKRNIPIKALVQKRHINYPPELVLQFLNNNGSGSGKGRLKHVINIDNFVMAIQNPGFALGFLKCLFLTKIGHKSNNTAQYTHQYTSKSEMPGADMSDIDIYNIDNFNSRRCEKLLRQLKPDLIITGPAAQILKSNILSIPLSGTLNAHPGILPQYRGMHCIEYSILNGDNPGITTYFIDKGIDTGEIILTRHLELSDGMTLAAAESQVALLSVELLADTVQTIAGGKYKRHSQDLSGGTQYYAIHPSLRELAQQSLRQVYGTKTVARKK